MKSPFKKDAKAYLTFDLKNREYKGVKVIVPTFYYECVKTGKRFTTEDIDDINLKILKEYYRTSPTVLENEEQS